MYNDDDQMTNPTKLIRTATAAISLDILLKGQLSYLSQYYSLTAVSSSSELLHVVEEREHVNCYAIEMAREISILQDIKSLIRLYLFLRKEKPLIVHSITPKAGLLSMVAGRLAGVPIRIHTFTGLIFPTRQGFIQKVLITTDRLLCKCATHIYPEGKGVMQDLLDYKITNKPLKILANGNVNGINLNYFNPLLFSNEQNETLRSQLNIEENDFTFIFVGRLVGDKGINELIEAFVSISKKRKNVKLLLVGPEEAELDPLLPRTIEEIHTNAQIISVGFQKDVRPYFAISDALVFPSYREGFPNVVMQAGAMNLPSIVTDINGCNEIIIEGENGIIIPSKDTNGLQLAMESYITNPTLLNQHKSNARQMIVSRYNQQVVWEALLAEYKLIESQHV